MKRKYNLFLEDILSSIEKIQEYTNNLDFAEFTTNNMAIDAVIRNLEIIGEASSQIPKDVKEKFSTIPWQQMKDFRNVVIHQYWVVDENILWDVIENKLQPLKEKIESILP